MLSVLLAVSKDGLLRRFEAHGHTGADWGRNVACAAATILLRTTHHACKERGMVALRSATHPGEMTMVLEERTGTHGEWLRGVTDFLVRGMSDLEREFPDQVALLVETTED